MAVVFIVSGEWDLRGAVRAELREAGIEALGLESVEEMARMIAGGIGPSLVVLDGALLHKTETRQAPAKFEFSTAHSRGRFPPESGPSAARRQHDSKTCSSARDRGTRIVHAFPAALLSPAGLC